MDINGYVMEIQPFSVNDGEGIRTNIFLAGCPLRCRWCSNPEGFEKRKVIGWHRRKCIGCGACEAVCPEGIGIDMDLKRAGCTACGECVSVCPAGARAGMVSLMGADDIIREVMKHRIFYSYSGGGVTFSGGEATMQPELLNYLSGELYDRGLSLAIESCGCFDFERVRTSLERMDLIFMDLKHMDTELHKKYTGVGNELILGNIKKLGSLRRPSDGGSRASDGEADESAPDIVIRIPVIGGVNNSEDNIRASAVFIHEALPDARMELLPYHRLGRIKYEALGLPFDQDELYRPDASEMERLRSIVRDSGVTVADYR